MNHFGNYLMVTDWSIFSPSQGIKWTLASCLTPWSFSKTILKRIPATTCWEASTYLPSSGTVPASSLCWMA